MAVDWENIAGSLVVRVNDLVDTTSLKLNTLHGLLDQKEDLSNKKIGLSSTDTSHYPNVPAVKYGIDQGILTANSYTDNSIDGIVTLLGNKVDKVTGKALSDENFTAILKQKLEEMESSKFRGAYPTIEDLKLEYPEGAGNTWHSGEGGWYADVGGVGQDSLRYIWDVDDFIWVESGIGGLTAEQVLQLLLANPDVNILDDSELAKLIGIEEEAQVNVQSDFGVSDQSSDAYIKGKPTKLTDFINDLTLVDTEYIGSTSILLRAGNEFQRAALTGDVTAARNSNALSIANNAVTTAKIANDAVTTVKILDKNVTSAKLADGVTTDIAKGVAAEGWGDHASAGYIKTYIDTKYTGKDGEITVSAANVIGINGGLKTNIANGQTAFDRGDHAGLYSLLNHQHVIGDVTGLTGALAGKENSFTKNTAFNKDFGSGATDVKRGNWRPAWGDITGIPSISEGTVTSVGLEVPTGLSIAGSPITSSGVLKIDFESGYSIPTTDKQNEWDAITSLGLQEVTNINNTTDKRINVESVNVQANEITVANFNKYKPILLSDGDVLIREITSTWNGTSWVSGNGIAVGNLAGANNSGANQLALGYQAGQNNSGGNQTPIGYRAGRYNSGANQTTLGYQAGLNNSGGNQTAIGTYAGQYNSGDDQVTLGTYAGQYNSGDYTNIIGQNYTGVQVGNTFTVVASNINNNEITIAGHGITQKGILRVPATINSTRLLAFEVKDANTLKVTNGDLIANGGLVEIAKRYDRINILGYNLNPTRSYQTILGGRSIFAPESTIAEINDVGNKALTTVEWVNDQGFATVAGATYTGSASIHKATGNEFQREALTGDVTALRNSNELTIANNAVTTVKILDKNVTSAKLADGVTTDIAKGVAAEGWGNHADAGYLKSADLNGYAKETWVTTNFAAKIHSHTIADVTNLQTELDKKALKTINLTAGTGLTGGGTIASNRSFAFDTVWGDARYSTVAGAKYTGKTNEIVVSAGREISLATKVTTDIAKGVTAEGWGDFRDYGLGKSNTSLDVNEERNTITYSDSSTIGNKVPGNRYGALLSLGGARDSNFQIFGEYERGESSEGIKYRVQRVGDWFDWVSVWDSNNLDPEDFAPIGSVLTAGTDITITDGKINNSRIHTGDVIGGKDLTIANKAVTYAKFQDMPTKTLLGNAKTASGVSQPITLGSNLTLSAAGVLNSSNSTYSKGSAAELVTGTSVIGRLWDAEVLTGHFAPIKGYPDWSAQLLSNLNF